MSAWTVLELIVPRATPCPAANVRRAAWSSVLSQGMCRATEGARPVSSLTFAASGIFSSMVRGVPGVVNTRNRVPELPNAHEEKIPGAAKVNELTGLAPSVALHIPWDKTEDYAALRTFAAGHGVALGTINSNTFQADIYKFGSLRPPQVGGGRAL